MVDPLDLTSVSVSTFVVTIGDVSGGVATGDECLNKLALAGGHARSDGLQAVLLRREHRSLVQNNLDAIVAGTICHFDINDVSFDRDIDRGRLQREHDPARPDQSERLEL